MKRRFTAMALVLLSPAFACLASEPAEELIQLSVRIHANGELVSEPAVMMKPGTDASVMVGLDPESPEWRGPGSGEGYLVKVTFHSTHLRKDGAEMLVDVDFGEGEAQHVNSEYLLMPWNEVHETQFTGEAGIPEIRIEVTPTRGTLEEMGRR